QAARASGVRLVAGVRLDLLCGTRLLVYPADRAAWSRLTQLLSLGKRRAGKGGCQLGWDDVAAAAAGQLGVLLPAGPAAMVSANAARLADVFGDRGYLALTLARRPGDAARLVALDALARSHRLTALATGDVLYHTPERRILQDVVSCIRLGCTIDTLGLRRARYADRALKAPAEMARRFVRLPHAVAASLELADRARFSLDELRYQYPDECHDPALTPQATLAARTQAGAHQRYPAGVPAVVATQLAHELRLIDALGYAPYFLTVDAIVRFARSRGILCQGRGSAANSAVCFVLGITSIDPARSELLFERFISAERHEPPDIDVDFEHERREEVIQWIYATYGRDRAALTAVVSCYRSKGAVREVGKALGLSEDVTAALSKSVWGWSRTAAREGVSDAQVAELNLDGADPRLQMTLDLARQLIGTPRHLSQHPGGFVLTQAPLADLVPIEPAAMQDRQIIEWDKDDIDALGFMKVDVLGLGMLGCLRRCFALLKAHKGIDLDLATIPAEDPATYAMIRAADTVGVFQIESRAQMNMLPRLKPRTFYDLVIEVAIVRPGPIQGDMVHPYLRRRDGLEPVVFPTAELERVLGRTLGVPLFQEQAMKVAIVCAGFSGGEADQLRRSMATFKLTGGVHHFHDRLVGGMLANGYPAEFAERTFAQIQGFGSYGFPESHAASFALLAYASSWLKCHHPDVFLTALLNAQPMGFYAPAQLVRDALAHGLTVRPVCVKHSQVESSLEPVVAGFAVRLGLDMVKGLALADAEQLVATRRPGHFASIEALWRGTGLGVGALARLAEADAFQALGLDRRAALWALKALRDEPLPLFAAADAGAPHPEAVEPVVALARLRAGAEVVEDYRAVRLSLRAHPLVFVRAELAAAGVRTCADLLATRDGRRIEIAGLVLVRQKPGSAKGVMFITLEDETGTANIVVWAAVFEANRRTVIGARMLRVAGRVQREGEVIHLIADRLTDASALLASVGGRDAGAIRPVTRDFR
ncbi:MAG: error-prone DNA polymerase, partial [Polymorphobacter sp.]